VAIEPEPESSVSTMKERMVENEVEDYFKRQVIL